MQIFCRTAENRCSEDLPYSHALIRVPTIVQREFKLAQRHGNQPESSSTRVQNTSVVKTFSVNSLIDNERALEKPSNPRRRARCEAVHHGSPWLRSSVAWSADTHRPFGSPPSFPAPTLVSVLAPKIEAVASG